ncbi:MAG: hypothetical protein ABIJ92_02620 [Candidatus Aenigmatarchaeota archaeon]
MNKKEVVAKLLEKGVLVSPGMLTNIDENNISGYMRTKSVVVTEPEEHKTERIKIEINTPEIKPKLDVQDVVNYYNVIYNNIHTVLEKKVDATSINKIGGTSSEVSIIGMIKEKTSHGFIIDDPTGEIEVVSNDPVESNTVIGVIGIVRENKLIQKKMVLPDLPLPQKTDTMNIILGLTAEKKSVKADTILTFTDEDVKEENEHKIDSKYSQVLVSKGRTKMKIIVYKPDENVNEEEATLFLKRRLITTNNKINNQILIENAPHIFWLVQNQDWNKIYKGVNIISTSKTVTVDLSSWKVEFI